MILLRLYFEMSEDIIIKIHGESLHINTNKKEKCWVWYISRIMSLDKCCQKIVIICLNQGIMKDESWRAGLFYVPLFWPILARTK